MIQRPLCTTLVGFVIAFTNLTPSASAQLPVSVAAEVGFRTKYFFAGIPFAAEQVTQPKVTATFGSFTLNGFGTFDHDAGEMTEADLYGDYYVQLAPRLGAYVGGALYNFNFLPGWEATPELYGGIVISAPLSPTLHVAHDFDLGDGTHLMLMLSHSVPLGTSGVSLNLAGNVDYNDGYWTPESGLSFFDVSAALGIPVGPVTVSPMVLLQRRIDDAFAGFIPDDELFGVTAAFTF